MNPSGMVSAALAWKTSLKKGAKVLLSLLHLPHLSHLEPGPRQDLEQSLPKKTFRSLMTLSALQPLSIPGKESIMRHISTKRSSSRRERRLLPVQGGGKGPNTVITIKHFQWPWKKVFSSQQRPSERARTGVTHWMLSHKKKHLEKGIKRLLLLNRKIRIYSCKAFQ